MEHHKQYKGRGGGGERGGGFFKPQHNTMSSKVRTMDCYFHIFDKKDKFIKTVGVKTHFNCFTENTHSSYNDPRN